MEKHLGHIKKKTLYPNPIDLALINILQLCRPKFGITDSSIFNLLWHTLYLTKASFRLLYSGTTLATFPSSTVSFLLSVRSNVSLVFKNILLLITSAIIDTPRSGWFDQKCCSLIRQWYPESKTIPRKLRSFITFRSGKVSDKLEVGLVAIYKENVQAFC